MNFRLVANEPYTNKLYLQKLTWFLFTSVYFDTTGFQEIQLIKNTLKQTKFEDKTVKSTQPSLVLIGPHDFLIFSNRTAHAWRVEAGNICSVSVFFRPSRQSNIFTSGEERFKYPLPWENKISQMPYPRANKDNQIPTPCPASPPPALHW